MKKKVPVDGMVRLFLIIFVLLWGTLLVAKLTDKMGEEKYVYLSCVEACDQKTTNWAVLGITKESQPSRCDGTATAICISECNKLRGIE